MNLNDMRGRVRQDLHDEDSQNYRWADAVLNRHIARALGEVSLASPLQARATLTTAAGSRDLSVAGLSGLIAVEAAEYPIAKYPPRYVRFSLWGDTLTLLMDDVPSGGESAYVYYSKQHALDATTSTLPVHLEDVVATGAAAYAAIEWASYATNRVNLGGDDTWRDYLTWGQDRLAQFAQELKRHSRSNSLRLRQLYRPYEPPASQATDWGP